MQTVFEFGDAKLRAKDIDPLYYALYKSGMDRDWLCAYTFAFVSFDLAGLACQIMDNSHKPGGFWAAMHAAMGQTKRGAPRRYFRGEAGHKALHTIAHRHASPARALQALSGSFYDAQKVMKDWPYYGPTAYFKMADMAERVCMIPINFDVITMRELMSNEQVTKGVQKALRHDPKLKTPADLRVAMDSYRWATKAGPDFKRKLNMQEFETILCYYSHDDAHQKHWPGDDIKNITAELSGWGQTAEKLIKLLPKGVK